MAERTLVRDETYAEFRQKRELEGTFKFGFHLYHLIHQA